MNSTVVGIVVSGTNVQIDALEKSFDRLFEEQSGAWYMFSGYNHIVIAARDGDCEYESQVFLTNIAYLKECLEMFFLPYVPMSSIKYWASDGAYLFITNNPEWMGWGGIVGCNYPCPEDDDCFASEELTEKDVKELLIKAFKVQGRHAEGYLQSLTFNQLVDLANATLGIHVYQFEHKELDDLIQEIADGY